eukprot:5666831-Alexandrium_andersonii.AAC.1
MARRPLAWRSLGPDVSGRTSRPVWRAPRAGGGCRSQVLHLAPHAVSRGPFGSRRLVCGLAGLSCGRSPGPLECSPPAWGLAP